MESRCKLCSNARTRPDRRKARPKRRYRKAPDVPLSIVTYWEDDMGVAWLALQIASQRWPGKGIFQPFAKAAMYRAVFRARNYEAGLHRDRAGNWNQTFAFSQLDKDLML